MVTVWSNCMNYFVKSKRTGNLWTAALTTLGYPGDSDNGTIQQRCDGPSYMTKIDDVLQIYQGSDFTGGSSGGPWIANFGYQKAQFSEGAGPGRNRSAMWSLVSLPGETMNPARNTITIPLDSGRIKSIRRTVTVLSGPAILRLCLMPCVPRNQRAVTRLIRNWDIVT